MMKYKCNLCNKEFNRKSTYDQHLKRKTRCKENIVDVNTNDDQITHKCIICNKIFKFRQGIFKHKKKYHPNYDDEVKLINESKRDEIKKIKLELREMKQLFDTTILKSKKSINNVLNSTSNITVNNNQSNQKLRLIDFGSEDFNKLNQTEINDILMSASESYITAFKYLHQNERLKEYQNIFINNLRSNDIYYVENGIFVIGNQRITIQNIINQLAECVEYLRNRNQDNMSGVIYNLMEERYKMFKNFDINAIHDKETKDKYYELCQQLRHMLYMNKELIKTIAYNNVKFLTL